MEDCCPQLLIFDFASSSTRLAHLCSQRSQHSSHADSLGLAHIPHKHTALKMTTTTMHFGPEWMRTRQAPSRPNPSPPLATPAAGSAPAGASTYSALVTPAAHPPAEKRDLSNPFRYSKDDMLRIYKEGGGKGGLGLEVERWEGIVREVGSDPISMKELNEAEKKVRGGRRREIWSSWLPHVPHCRFSRGL